jgi:predicted hotdog family 3-hydroxylacyl-ACP dehydratase
MVMLRDCPYSIDELLIHRSPMLLLDKVIGYNESGVVASVVIADSSLFITPRGVPGHVAIEYMAQACGAYAGAMALDAGAPVKIGLLIGTRACRVLVPWFVRGATLSVSALIAFHDEQLAVFDCKIEIDGQLAADAQLKVFQPEVPLFQIDEDK